VPQLDVNGLRFHVQTLPETPPAGSTRPKVVMIHGLVIDNLSSYYYTIASPVALVADTYLYDLRGHGRTQTPTAGYGVAEHVADLRALLDEWDIAGPVHLVGNSFGGLIALAFCDRYPELVASLVLIEAHFPIEGWGEHMAGSLALAAFGLDEQASKDWLANEGSRKMQKLARHSEYLFLKTSLIADLQQEQPFSRHALERIACPTLAIYGDGSDILDRARDLERYVPGCELHIAPDSDHGVLTAATSFVRDLIVGWITRGA
jgi:pimeloyl-ACP methyl ester carboxylesterase